MDSNLSKASSYELARSILGMDFITPEEIVQTRGLSYSNAQLRHFTETVPSKQVLQWCCESGFMLIAGPPCAMSLLSIRILKTVLFYREAGGWYARNDQRFSRVDKVGINWLMLQKAPVRNSSNKTWSTQLKLLSEEMFIPNAPEIIWAVTTYKEVRNSYLLHKASVRTSSVDTNGNHVSIGYFGNSGLHINSNWNNDRSSSLGISSAHWAN